MVGANVPTTFKKAGDIMIFKINGKTLPTPAHGLNEQRVQLVDSARNAKGQVKAKKIGGRQIKFDGVVFPHLTADEWGEVLKEIEKFTGTLHYYDSKDGKFKDLKVYWGDASAEVWKINPKTGKILEYINCKCNIIDMGY